MDVYWLEQSASDVPETDDWLTPYERARLDSLRFPKRRADWRLGRWTAKQVVAVCLELPSPAAIEIRAAPSGAPQAFVAGDRAQLAISISHRRGVAVCAAAPDAIALGCDLELVEPRSDEFVADYLTVDEQALVAREPAVVNVLWSAKESALKALGEGLRLDTRRVAVEIGTTAEGVHGWHPLRVRCPGGETLDGWWDSDGELVRTMVASPAPHPPVLFGVLARTGIAPQQQ
ncbi:MAG TPA: 4'-phosphopantetheinyl transferase superfamily protein [Bryobacteraceae bacterium]|jgi:4'-phosphopantetheinyl transferase